jgi:HEAT repeat protein
MRSATAAWICLALAGTLACERIADKATEALLAANERPSRPAPAVTPPKQQRPTAPTAPLDATPPAAGPATKEEVRALLEQAVAEATRADALKQLRARRNSVVPHLVAELRGDDRRLRMAAVLAIGHVGENPDEFELEDGSSVYTLGLSAAADAVPELVNALERSDEVAFQGLAIHSLGQIGREADAAVPAIIALSSHADPSIRYHAVQALGRIQGDEHASIDALEKRLGDEKAVRMEAIAAIARFGNLTRAMGMETTTAGHVGRRLVTYLNNPDPEVAAVAMRGLVGIGRENAEIRRAVLQRLESSDAQIRYYAVVAVGEFVDEEPGAVAKLRDVAENDSDRQVRYAALEILAESEGSRRPEP